MPNPDCRLLTHAEMEEIREMVRFGDDDVWACSPTHPAEAAHDPARWVNAIADDRNRIAAERDAAMELLRRLEWSGRYTVTDSCPVCNGLRPDSYPVCYLHFGHKPGCELAALLGKGGAS